MKFQSNQRRAFTLLEIMLVVTIIALLLGAAVNAFKGNVGIAQGTRVKADIQSLSTALTIYQAMNGFYPTTEQGLQALVTRPDSNPRPRQWKKAFDKVPIDPFGNEYKYVQPGTHNPDSYDLYSMGQDRKDGTADDQGNWESNN